MTRKIRPEADDELGLVLDDGAEQLLAPPPRLLGPPAPGDVAADRLVLDDATRRVEERAVGPVLPARAAVRPDGVHLVGHGRRLGREGGELGGEAVPLLRGHEGQERGADDRLRPPAELGGVGLVDESDREVGREARDELGLVLDDGAEALLAQPELGLGAPLLGDVDDGGQHRRPPGVVDRARRHERVHPPAVRPDQHGLDVAHEALRRDAREIALARRGVGPDRGDRVAGPEAEDLLRAPVGEQELGRVRVADQDRDRHPFGDRTAARLALAQGPVRLLARGDVPHVGDEQALAAGGGLHDRELDREQGAVGPHALRLDPPAQHAALAGREQARQPGRVRRAEVRRHHDLAERTPDRLLAAVAEDALGRRVELAQHAALVHDDHAIERHVDDGAGERVGTGCSHGGSAPAGCRGHEHVAAAADGLDHLGLARVGLDLLP